MTPDRFRCYLATKDESGKAHAAVTYKSIDELPAGDVLIRVAWSSLNYKDALSASGHAGVTRKYPHVPGIDAAGTVVDSKSAEIRPGAEVLVTGYDLGQNTWGGFAEYVRVPAGWVVPLPQGLTLRESMIYGTAGFTAAQCVDALVRHGVAPSQGNVLVTGASGGVGSLAVALLAKTGYRVVASSGKPSAHDLVKMAGAAEIISRRDARHEREAAPAHALERRSGHCWRGHAGDRRAIAQSRWLRGGMWAGRGHRTETHGVSVLAPRRRPGRDRLRGMSDGDPAPLVAALGHGMEAGMSGAAGGGSRFQRTAGAHRTDPGWPGRGARARQADWRLSDV